MPSPLVEGVYEHVITEELERALEELGDAFERELASIDAADVPVVLARHIAREIERVLEDQPEKRRVEAARGLVNGLLDQLAGQVGKGADVVRAQTVREPAQRLLSLYRAKKPARPSTALSMSTLLTRNRAEPSLAHELSHEIASADRIDAIVAFVTVGGVRVLDEALEEFARRGGRLRLLTTTFTGTTQLAALDGLARRPGVEVKVSFDVRRTRLHAKAWLFHRDSGLSTAYVGSANLTKTALGGGHEWMIKACRADLPHVLDKFSGTFDTLWADPEFERFDSQDENHRARLRQALGAQRRAGDDKLTRLIHLRPYPFQEEILDRLEAERQIHERTRNLVVAATGTGKTVVAAFDFARHAARAGIRPRLLFLAHRRELLEQARDTFRHVLQDPAFGELWTGKDAPRSFDHVFATIQTAAGAAEMQRLGDHHFKHVVVDECHHVPADSYQSLVPRLMPDIMVGLTATPERTDGRSLLPDFDDHVAAELRLWHALEGQLLVPFEYYGINDGVDLKRVRWSRTGYSLADLNDIYTGNEKRAALIVEQLRRRVAELRAVRALGFCVSIEHAEYMAAQFSAHGVPALAVHGRVPDDVRDDAPRRLREREVNVLFTCDLYNEGIDLPFVDTLLLLRPTSSSTLFLQQLGRGLRVAEGKTCCLVLDFIGQHRSEFRFDTTLAAVTGIPRAGLRKAIEQGFPYLPSGCTVQLDEVARHRVLTSLRATIASAQQLGRELRELSAATQRSLSLREFIDLTGRDLQDAYGDKYGWRTIRRLAGLVEEDPDLEDLSRRLGWLTHVDEPERLRFYSRAMRDGRKAKLDASARARLHMLHFQLNHRGVIPAAEETAQYFADRSEIAAEYDELRAVLEDNTTLPNDVYPVADWPLALHRHYQRREIIPAVGYVAANDKGITPQGGVLKLKDGSRRELLFVTLDKSGKSFSPTTRYRDYAISRELFHWETQAAASVNRPSGRRYIDPGNGYSFFLFVRPGPGAAFAFLGPVTYEGHTGDRPIAITWRLTYRMPAGLFERYASLAN